MSDRWSDRLSDYLDEELDSADRTELETHLRVCAECSATLAGLRRVVMRAKELPEPRPDHDLWPGIEARIRMRPHAIPIRRAGGWSERRVSLSMAQLAAACVAVLLLGGALVWHAGHAGRPDPGELIPGSRSDALNALAPAGAGTAPTSAAVEELRRALASGRDELDPTTVRTLEESLTVIEIAIEQARRALEADPRNPYVRAHLDETMRRKVELLHRATMLASAPR